MIGQNIHTIWLAKTFVGCTWWRFEPVWYRPVPRGWEALTVLWYHVVMAGGTWWLHCMHSFRWQQEGRRASMALSLDKAILQDNQNDINERDGIEPVWASFTPHAYMQVGCLPFPSFSFVRLILPYPSIGISWGLFWLYILVTFWSPILGILASNIKLFRTLSISTCCFM